MNPSTPLVSVIMPAYNAVAYIDEAIQSILDQSYTHFELIISDDGSTDQTLSIVARYSDVRIICLKNHRNLGYAGNMNVLLKAAKGKYIVIQDADDYSATDRLEVLVDFLERHTAIDIVGSSYVKIEEGKKEERISVVDDREIIKQAFVNMIDPLPVLNGSVMFKKKIVEEGILFRHLIYVNRGQDDDWLFRVAEKFNATNIDKPLYYYRTNSSSMTLNVSHINYFSIFSGDYVRFLKTYRMEQKSDLLEEQNKLVLASFFAQKKKEVTDRDPAYLELYIAHKYLAQENRLHTLK